MVRILIVREDDSLSIYPSKTINNLNPWSDLQSIRIWDPKLSNII